ncbi:MAG: gamma-glutamylcyclotransferase [Saprospiraceae bacterium]|nr:gamma-glutamylcyclotransferase [Saprospiraceae bacterium]
MSILLFAYGTLKRESSILSDLRIAYRKIGPARIKGIPQSGTEYPAIVKPNANQGEWIPGELIELLKGEKDLAKLDEYEEYDPLNPNLSLYQRELALVYPTSKDQPASAYVYWFNQHAKKAEFE